MTENKPIKISLFEKIVVNWALPSDFLYHTAKAFLLNNKSQTMRQRIMGLWDGKTDKYLKILEMKREYGHIPKNVKLVCNKTLCGQTRLILAFFRRV